MIKNINLAVSGQGLHSVTQDIQKVVEASRYTEGLCTVFIQHTSASLLIQENYDASAQRDLEAWLNRLVPEGDALYTHTTEGADDMPAHIKATLTATSLSIPVVDGALALGAWQGVYLWEHRYGPQRRSLVVHVGG